MSKEVCVVFRIQASNPRNNATHIESDCKLSEAIETIFPMMTEDAFIIWKAIHIPLSYKYDISYMIDDVLSMLKMIRNNPEGARMSIHWPSNTFSCIWDISWDDSMLQISSKWNSVVGGVTPLLNSESELKAKKKGFVAEWKSILRVLIENLESCGYSNGNLADMNRLYIEYEGIPDYGVLYTQKS